MMLNIKETLAQLEKLGLSSDEAKLYVTLLKQPSNHLRLSRATGIDRAKVYRLVERLEKRSLVARHTDDRGTFLVAADPDVLEIDLASEEQRLTERRNVLNMVLPSLNSLRAMTAPGQAGFNFKTYEGQAGFKQMCWNELKTEDEIITFGHGNIETLVGDLHWADRHRLYQLEARYRTRDLVNPQKAIRSKLANERLYQANLYRAGVIDSEILSFDDQTVIYNNTVSIYHWQEDQKIGIEIISATYAAMMRQLFEHYWQISKEVSLAALS